MSDDPRAAVVLLSGGLDSATVLALACALGRRAHALSFRYGQRHALELGCASVQARRAGVVAHEIVDLTHLGPLLAPATALIAGSPHAVPKDREPEAAGTIPLTYVPARNTLFLAYALAWAEAIDAGEIWIGVNALDYSGYPDCRPAFIAAFAELAALGTRRGVEGDPIRIETPLLHLHKHEIVALGEEHGVDYAETLSCYDPVVDGDRALACGHCESCTLRKRGFADADVADPTRYVPNLSSRPSGP